MGVNVALRIGYVRRDFGAICFLARLSSFLTKEARSR